MTDDLLYMDAQALACRYVRRELTPREMVEALIARRADVDSLLNAFAGVDDEAAIAQADGAGRKYGAGHEVSPLCGIPVAVKDLIDTRGTRTAYGSRLFATNVPTEDARVVRATRAAWMPMIGKATTHEFAWGITCESEHYGPCRNPWDTSRVAGGSSGGSAVAVATGQACVAIGTDTAGSVRIPAAFCGVVGFKPTFGLVSTSGIFPLAPSLDNVGALARTPQDARRLVAVLLDKRSRCGGETLRQPPVELAGLRVGAVDIIDAPPLEQSISRCLCRAADVLRDLGAQVEVEQLALTYDPVVALGRVQAVEAFATHARRGLYPARAAEYGTDVRDRLDAASTVGLEDYLNGLEASWHIRTELEGLFERYDLLLSAVSAVPPPRIGDTADLRDLVLPFTAIHSVGGLPTCVVRAGFDSKGLPIGVQLAGPRLSDDLVLDAACALYEATPSVQAKRPSIGEARDRRRESDQRNA